MVLPRAPRRGNSPVPRGPPQGIPRADEPVLVTAYAARDAVSRCGHRALAAEGNGFGVASRPRETAALPGPIAQRGWPRPLCNPRPGLSRPGPRAACALSGYGAPWPVVTGSGERETSALPLQTHRPDYAGRLRQAEPGNGAPRNPRFRQIGGARAMAAAASRSRLCARVESARIGAAGQRYR